MLEFCSVEPSYPKDPNIKHDECKLDNLVPMNCVHIPHHAVGLDSLPKTISVQSSYKLHLPPYLLVHSVNIKLVEPIGQGDMHAETHAEKHAERNMYA
jgi:hypothetical protein